MINDDYVELIEPRCRFFTEHDYVPAGGESPIFVPANWNEKIFFELIVPSHDAQQAQLTGSRVCIAKVWDEKEKTMQDLEYKADVATVLDVQTTTDPMEISRAMFKGGKRGLGFPQPIIGVYVRLDSRKVHDRLKPFDFGLNYEGGNTYQRIHIGKEIENDEFTGYIPVESILGYVAPKRFVERENGFTGSLDVDTGWIPSDALAEFIDRRIKEYNSKRTGIYFPHTTRSCDLLNLKTVHGIKETPFTPEEISSFRERYAKSAFPPKEQTHEQHKIGSRYVLVSVSKYV